MASSSTIVKTKRRPKKTKRISTRTLLNAIKECSNAEGGSIAEIKRRVNKNVDKPKDMASTSCVKLAIGRAVKSGLLNPPRKGWQGFRGMDRTKTSAKGRVGARKTTGGKGAGGRRTAGKKAKTVGKKRGPKAKVKEANKANKSENYNPMEEDGENTSKSLLQHFTSACVIM